MEKIHHFDARVCYHNGELKKLYDESYKNDGKDQQQNNEFDKYLKSNNTFEDIINFVKKDCSQKIETISATDNEL